MREGVDGAGKVEADPVITGKRVVPWTHGAVKWAAVGVLGVTSVAGVWWSIVRSPVVAPLSRGEVVAPGRASLGAAAGAGEAERRALPVAEKAETEKAETEKAETEAEADVSGGLKVRRVNINTATAGELETLPGIGPALAARIVEHRTRRGAFKTVDGLDAVPGIGAERLRRLRDLVTVGE